jgi:hypothetical protein
MSNKLVDRGREIRELRELSERASASLGLLYGRRRVGKTFLLRNVWEKQRLFYFLAADETTERNRVELLQEMERYFEDKIYEEDYPNWRTVFRLLAELAERSDTVVVLDEFQNFLQDNDQEDIPSKLAAVWEEVIEKNITLILCGSEISMMKSLNKGKAAPLYGRFNWSQRLRPFTYREVDMMVEGLNPREIVEVYAIYGGMPQYLNTICTAHPLNENVVETILSPRGEVNLQISSLFAQERGIREPGAYHAILTAIAGGNTTVNEIAQASGVQGENNTITRKKLSVLQSLYLIDRERNCDEKRGPYHYYILDHGVHFWYKFVLPNRSRLELGDERGVWDEQISPALNSYVGQIFEHICRESFVHHHKNWKLPAFKSWGRWQGQDRNKRSIEIDIVAELEDGLRLTGEIKWSSRPVDVDVYYGHQRDLEDLSNSGRKWAHEAFEEAGQQIFFSAAGFTSSFEDIAAEEDIILITLEDMFER